jgi:hypothetical protein
MYVSLFKILKFTTKPRIGQLVILPASKWSRSMPGDLQQHCHVAMLPRVNSHLVHSCEKLEIIDDPILAKIDAIIVLDPIYTQQEEDWLKLQINQVHIVELTIINSTKNAEDSSIIYDNMKRNIVP